MVVMKSKYEQRVEDMAAALHVDCRLEWQAIAAVDPERQVTQHAADAHYGQAHNLVRRIWPALDVASAAPPADPSPLREALERLAMSWEAVADNADPDLGTPGALIAGTWRKAAADLRARLKETA